MLNISYGLKESKKIIYYMSEMIQPVWNIIQKERIRLYKISNRKRILLSYCFIYQRDEMIQLE